VTAGPLLFARYAYPPNELGYCGPADHGALLDYAAAGVSDRGLAQLARGFDGAWPYLQMIAGASGIADPLDARVVEAYWVGNGLLERVNMGAYGRFLEDRFRRRAGRGWDALAQAIPAGAVAHHSFHVFLVYPWVGLMRAGWSEQPLRVLDRCRIRWGTVVSTGQGTADVRCRPLTWDGRLLSLGPPRVERALAAAGGKALAGGLRAGDVVALHWDWVCDRLTAARAQSLRWYTRRHLRLANAAPAAGERAAGR